ncbi:hypothetical protein ACI3E1_06245 [Ligilactobacillus sp. LYQ139]|uniref:hypothetical protein n=1 Tax=Ligilactobacillus sp. LYQ139 TaxID=3378800 RepID=UPI003854EFB4
MKHESIKKATAWDGGWKNKNFISEFMPKKLQCQYFFGGLHRMMKGLSPKKQNLLLETLITINKGNEFEQIALHERRNTK